MPNHSQPDINKTFEAETADNLADTSFREIGRSLKKGRFIRGFKLLNKYMVQLGVDEALEADIKSARYSAICPRTNELCPVRQQCVAAKQAAEHELSPGVIIKKRLKHSLSMLGLINIAAYHYPGDADILTKAPYRAIVEAADSVLDLHCGSRNCIVEGNLSTPEYFDLKQAVDNVDLTHQVT